MYFIFVFKSRTNSIYYYELLKKDNIPCVVISTPTAAHVGCGLSVKVDGRHLEDAKRIFRYASFGSFLGLFRVTQIDRQSRIERVPF